uniref:Uncharacterized protein n=1 Tax=Globodera rostochiensis TaxID=31243 RepID=A0A914HM82_GLORO
MFGLTGAVNFCIIFRTLFHSVKSSLSDGAPSGAVLSDAPPPPYSSNFNPAPINTPPAAPYTISPCQPQTSSATVCLGLAPCVCTPSNGSAADLANFRPLYFLILALFVTVILCME